MIILQAPPAKKEVIVVAVQQPQKIGKKYQVVQEAQVVAEAVQQKQLQVNLLQKNVALAQAQVEAAVQVASAAVVFQ